MAERRAASAGAAMNPMAEADSDDVEARLAAHDEKIAGLEEQLIAQGGVSLAGLARIGTAPTNWHQATVYFLTSKAEEDAGMKRKAPLLYAASLMMVLVQTFAVFGMLSGMLHPSCVSN
eukprot:COSAG04_NODE_6573_length_1302_cov_1.271820_1_plen_118_part_10